MSEPIRVTPQVDRWQQGRTGRPGRYVGEDGARRALPHRRQLVDLEVPCASDPDAWFATAPEAVERAVDACHDCPVMTQCAEFAEALRPSDGVWAGVDRTVYRRGPR